MKKLLYIVVLSLNVLCCGSGQHRLHFDLSLNAFLSCDERLKIKKVTIQEKATGNTYRIVLKRGNEGMSILYLDRENKGYYSNATYPIRLQPNSEYVITSTAMDSALEMNAFTDNEGRIDSIINNFDCKKITFNQK